MSKKLLNISLLALSLATSSCATLLGDNDRQITINTTRDLAIDRQITVNTNSSGADARQINVNTNPSGVNVYLNGNLRGSTPMILTLPNYIYNGVDITLKKDGYLDTKVTINSQFQMVGLWNLLNGVGFLIDLATGDFMKLDSTQLNQNINLGVLPKK